MHYNIIQLMVIQLECSKTHGVVRKLRPTLNQKASLITGLRVNFVCKDLPRKG